MTVNLFADCALNPDLVHQAVVAYMAGGRQGSVAQKTRAQVRGGGRKPWKQKKLGRARAGSIRSPIWRGGGVTFAASPRDHSVRLNKRMFRLALRSILAEKARQGQVVSIELPQLAEPKTRLLIEALKEQKLNLKGLLLVTEQVPERNLQLASRNLHGVEVMAFRQINPVALLAADTLVIAPPALKAIEAWLS